MLILAGAPGFEPGNGGIKIRCLTTWLRPIALGSGADHTGGVGPVNLSTPPGAPAHRNEII